MQQHRVSQKNDRIPAEFIQRATDVLGETTSGLSASQIIRKTVAYAVDFDVSLPHPTHPANTPNKRTTFYENLMAFSPPQQYKILVELCDDTLFRTSSEESRRQLKIELLSKYGHLSGHTQLQNINESLVEETIHWLERFPAAHKLFQDAKQKYQHGLFHRNVLDDLRLSLEQLLRDLFQNSKSLENQLTEVGAHIKKAVVHKSSQICFISC